MADQTDREWWEWGVVFGIAEDGDDPPEGAGLLSYDEEASAREMTQWLADSRVVRRRVQVGIWETAPPEQPDPIPQHVCQEFTTPCPTCGRFRDGGPDA